MPAAARERLATQSEKIPARHPQAPVLLNIPGIGAHTASQHGELPAAEAGSAAFAGEPIT